jgi:formylglycine-generating enzyme required for sulfatase activity
MGIIIALTVVAFLLFSTIIIIVIVNNNNNQVAVSKEFDRGQEIRNNVSDVNVNRESTPPLTVKPSLVQNNTISKESSTKLSKEDFIDKESNIEFIYIKDSVYVIGSPLGEIDRREDESEHKIRMNYDFWISKYEITQKQWSALIGPPNPSQFVGSNRPVDSVSWFDCMRFCKKLNGISKPDSNYVYSLPTEAMWEIACRADSIDPFNVGESIDNKSANFSYSLPYNTESLINAKDPIGTVSVGSFIPNAWGFHDMHGNVMEWTLDDYRKYDIDEVEDPLVKENTNLKSIRGGRWIDSASLCRSSSRDKDNPYFKDDTIGFRIALIHKSYLSRLE